MELSSILQLEQMSLGDANELSSGPSPTSLSPDSPHAPSLTSLPPELIGTIFETLYDNDSVRKRKADLARLCLVSKRLRLIAQPLLFRAFVLDLGQHQAFPECVLFSGLGYGEESAGMVKELMKSFETVLSEESDLELAVILHRLSQLQTIRVGWREYYLEAPSSSINLLVEMCPRIRHLELPNVTVQLVDLGNVAVNLPHLETLIVDLPKLDTPSALSDLSPAFHLHRFVATSLPDPGLLLPLLSSSTTSLLSLSLAASSASPLPSLSPFVNLRSLSYKAFDPSTQGLRNIHALLLSSQRLPIQSVAIHWSDELDEEIHDILDEEIHDIDKSILQVLPPSTRSLTFGPYNHSSLNWLSLTSTNGTRPYPSLEHLSIVPLCPQYSDPRQPVQLSPSETELVTAGKECGMEVEWIREDEDYPHRLDVLVLDRPRVLSGDFDDDMERQEEDRKVYVFDESDEESDYGDWKHYY